MRPYAGAISRQAARNGLDAVKFAQLLYFESGGNPKAVSSKDAVGLAQIHLPSHPDISRAQAENPAFAIRWAARFFAQQVQTYGSYQAAYNQGYNPGYSGPGPFGGSGGGGAQQAAAQAMSTMGAPAGGLPNSAPDPAVNTTVPQDTGLPTAPPDPGTAPQPEMPGYVAAPASDDISQVWKNVAAMPLSSPESQRFAAYAPNPVQAVQDPLQHTPAKQDSGAYDPKWVSLAAGADRKGAKTSSAILGFATLVAEQFGRKLTITTGTNHNQYVEGTNRQSAHWTGNAVDIAMKGKDLTWLGQAALIAAGMDPDKARKIHGGLFNIGGYQIIFNSRIGGNHYNHLHIGLRR